MVSSVSGVQNPYRHLRPKLPLTVAWVALVNFLAWAVAIALVGRILIICRWVTWRYNVFPLQWMATMVRGYPVSPVTPTSLPRKGSRGSSLLSPPWAFLGHSFMSRLRLATKPVVLRTVVTVPWGPLWLTVRKLVCPT